MAPKTELNLPKYELLKELGHGGMATVYLARDKRLGREVALKVIHRHLREKEEVQSRFSSEALAVAKVKHPNIVEVYDVSAESDPERYLVVEYISGETLREELNEYGALPPEVAIAIGLKLCAALAHAHEQGVIHRDLKPENVLVSLKNLHPEAAGASRETARVKLADFGIAKLLDAQGVTHTGEVLGSPAYMAPEQIECDEIDVRADVFALGVLLYELMLGQVPFAGNNPAQILRRVLEGSYTPPLRVDARIGARYAGIIEKCLRQEPAERFSYVTELSHELETELARLSSEEPRRIISNYLRDRDSYRQASLLEIPGRLLELGKVARSQRNPLNAADDFNRALAYAPQDDDLLQQITALSRASRWRVCAKFVCFATPLLGLLVGAVFWFSARTSEGNVFQDELSQLESVASGLEAALAADKSVSDEQAPAKLPFAEPERPARPSAANRRPPGLRRARALPAKGMRRVRTIVKGPQNATMKIDGREVPWFQAHQLTLGEHLFEFFPPDDECCTRPAPQRVDVVAGQGAQLVRGVISFRNAVLLLNAPAGARASCGLAGIIRPGKSRQIPMDSSTRPISCMVYPAPGSDFQPRRIDVTLHPGRTFTINGR
ncbi:MAG: serine/threonine protein kinase [Polyangiaceae bacterium]|nr:serine/threonine protein kinase [Polyangiaceae bacterium]